MAFQTDCIEVPDYLTEENEDMKFPPFFISVKFRQFIDWQTACMAAEFKLSCIMPAAILKAHFDGKQIVLDEPFDLPPNSPLVVTVLSSEESIEDAQWRDLSAHGLATAYGDDEPDYSAADVKR